MYRNEMDVSRELDGGRVQQRRRTRQAIIDAARAELDAGRQTSLSEVAKLAGVSRATAYRYFANTDELMAEAAIDYFGDLPEHVIPMAAPVAERLLGVIQAHLRIVGENQAAFRAYTGLMMQKWLSLQGDDDAPPFRQGRRVRWMDHAFGDAAIDPERRRRLTIALSMLCGIEAMIVTEDIFGCDQDETVGVASWAARTLIEATLDPG